MDTSPSTLYSMTASWANLALELPFMVDRLRGVRGIRADLVYTVEHNCNPFHQGLLVPCFQYGANQWPRRNPFACTNLPHVRLDVSHNTRAVLKVPYLSELEYFGNSESEVNHVMGTFSLVQVLPTPALAGSNTPVYKIYLHFENIELFGRMPIAGSTLVVPQSGVAKRLTGKSNAEAELENNGQFSGVLAAAARLPTAVGNAFPSLRAFTGPTTWFLNCAAKAASAFGFSKPVPSAALVRQVRFPNYCENNVDVPAPASVVGGFQTNSVAVSEALGGTDLDEMAFDSILTRYSQICRNSISTSDAHGTVVYASKVCLTHFWFRLPPPGPNGGNKELPRNTTTAAAIYPSTLLNVAQHFRFWHGGLKFRVTFAKSKFHTGRVLFSFIPSYQRISTVNVASDVGFGGGLVPGTLNGDLQPSQYSLIYDLKDGSEFEFEVPYIAPVSHLGINDSMGFVSMQIMDPLVNNGESFPTIFYMVEVAAMPGFYFSGLGTPGQPVFADALDPIIQFQSGVGAKTMDASQYSVGEKFSSLKQLMMVQSPRRYSSPAGTFQVGLVPMWCCVPAWGDGSPLAVNTTRSWALPRSGMIAQCYAYGIGSTLLYWYAQPGNNSHARIVLNQRDNNDAVFGTAPSIYTSTLDQPASPYSAMISGVSPSGLFLLPALSASPRFRIGDFNTVLSPLPNTRDWSPTTSGVTSASLSVKAAYNLLHRNDDGTARICYWSVAAADDARCAAYIGPCPWLISNALSTNSTWWNSPGL